MGQSSAANSGKPFESKTFHVEIERVLPSAQWGVLRLLTKPQDFQKFIPIVKSCVVISHAELKAVTQWKIEVKDFTMDWQQEEKVDLKNFEIHFRAIKGDFEVFEGSWKLLKDQEHSTKVVFTLRVKIGIPQIEDAIGELLTDRLKSVFHAMLDAMAEALVFERYRCIANHKKNGVGGFAVIGHPYNYDHLVRIFKFFKEDVRIPPPAFLSKILEMTPAYASHQIKSFKSKTGKVTQGHFIMCPIVPDMLEIDGHKVMRKVVQACRIAEELGIGVATLGGFTSIAGEKYAREFLDAIHLPVTTGNTYTTVLTLQGIRKAAKLMGIDMKKARVAIIGGAGDIGSACARSLMNEVGEVVITSRSERNLMDMERQLIYLGNAKLSLMKDNREAVKNADIVIAAASVPKSIISLDDFKSGAVICDIGYPKNIAYAECDRDDILIFSGGLASLPDDFDLSFDGLPSSRILYGCFAEALVLDLEERYQRFSWGKGHISNENMAWIEKAAEKHGFGLAPFFWGDHLLKDEEIRQIRESAQV